MVIPSQPMIPGSLSTFASWCACDSFQYSRHSGFLMDVWRSVSVTMISRMILNLHEHANVGIMSSVRNQNTSFALQSLPDIPMILTEPDFDSQVYPVRDILAPELYPVPVSTSELRYPTRTTSGNPLDPIIEDSEG